MSDLSAVGIPLLGLGEDAYNFGILDGPDHIRSAHDGVPYLYEAFPALEGKWDGQTTVNHHVAARVVLGGTNLPAHMQPRGTCGGRAGARGLELLQCVAIGTGQRRAKFKFVSHAWIYYLCRREGRMLGAGDGVPSWSVGPALAKFGAVTREEANDLDMNGPRSDDLAARYGAGQISREEVARLTSLASDNLVTARVRARTAQEMADGIAAGGIAVRSGRQGYTMVRDQHGFCKPWGRWDHYHIRSGVRPTPVGAGFQYDQSWGDKLVDPTSPGPYGPLVEGCPGNVFLTSWEEEDRLLRGGEECDIIFAFDLWDLEENLVPDLPWVF